MDNFEWCVMSKEGYMHRGPMNQQQAETWVVQWKSITNPNDLFYVARRPVGEWERFDG